MVPEELEKLPKPLERIMRELEDDIMGEVVERIMETSKITPTIDWLLQRMAAIGASKSNLKKRIERGLKETDINVDAIYKAAASADDVRYKQLYQEIGKDYIAYDDNIWLQQLVEAIGRQTKDNLRPMENITRTMGFTVNVGGEKVFTPLSEYLERTLDRAMLAIVSGAKSYTQSIYDVIDEMTYSGVRVIDYASGKSERVEVVVRRAIMTGVAQLTDKVNEKNKEELEGSGWQVDWEVDWHMGARNTGTGYLNHQSWQGKVYNDAEMKTICGLGEMLGFAGINCYHVRFPFIQGISKRKYTDEWLEAQNKKENTKRYYKGKEYDVYGALQHQRKLERTIRKRKQDVLLLEKAGADKEEITAAKSKLQLVNKEYVDFSKAMDLRQQRERLKIANINASAKEAVRNTFTKVTFNPENDYRISLNRYSDEVNKGLSDAIRSVAEKGSADGYEHMHLVNLKSGVVEYYETNHAENEVGYDFWKHLKAYPDAQFAFVHNHNTDSSFSETDMRTLMMTEEIPVMIAARNDGVIYVAERAGDVLRNTTFDDLYMDGIKTLNQQARDGIITIAERSLKREVMIVNNLLRDYTKGGKLIEYDGRKK